MEPILRNFRNLVLVTCVAFGSLTLVVVQAARAEAAPSAWSVNPSPNRGSETNSLNAVSCTSATSCIAVGYGYNQSGLARTLVESWNGSTWSKVRSPNQGADDSYLYGVYCTDFDNCVAVGDYITPGASGATLTLIESWKGGSWSISPSADPSTTTNLLTSVYCTVSTSCVAVGSDEMGSGELERSDTLVESLTENTWSVIPTQDTGKGDTLSGVSCTTSARCTAVGYAFNGDTGGSFTVVETWDGTKWSIIPSPSPGSFDSRLYSVSCPRESRCIAVGYADKGREIVPKALIESWNGTAWSVIHSPKPDYASFLYGISCTSRATVYRSATTRPTIRRRFRRSSNPGTGPLGR